MELENLGKLFYDTWLCFSIREYVLLHILHGKSTLRSIQVSERGCEVHSELGLGHQRVHFMF